MLPTMTRPVAAQRKHLLTSSAVLMPSLASIIWLNALCTILDVLPLLVVAVAPLAYAVHLTCASDIFTRRWRCSSP